MTGTGRPRAPGHSHSRARWLTPRVIAVVQVVNMLEIHGDQVVVADLREVLTAIGLCSHDRGNQSLGDTLGRCGLGLRTETRQYDGAKVYVPPVGGIDRAYLESRFRIPIGFDWGQVDLYDLC